MMGRAGRPQFDTKGVACIMTEYNLKNRYEKLINSEVSPFVLRFLSIADFGADDSRKRSAQELD